MGKEKEGARAKGTTWQGMSHGGDCGWCEGKEKESELKAEQNISSRDWIEEGGVVEEFAGRVLRRNEGGR